MRPNQLKVLHSKLEPKGRNSYEKGFWRTSSW